MTLVAQLGSLLMELQHIPLKCLLGVEVELVVTQALEQVAVVARQPALWL